jgi:predicted ATPase
MSHRFGDLLTQHLHRKHGLSQAKLAAGISQDPTLIAKMCKGERLTGPQARERVLVIISWLHGQGVLQTRHEADALLIAAGLAPLHDAESDATEAAVIGKLSGAHGAAPPPFEPSFRNCRLPSPPTPFVGRQADLDTINNHLSDPRCRMLTLIGPGGVGKTRLAIEAASTRMNAYAHGVCFVDLQSVSDSASLPFAIADALEIALSGDDAPYRQLERHLANRHVLLLLDNFEQLMSGVAALSALLAAAPQVQLLVTSREALNLSEEWQYWVEGIRCPPVGQAWTVQALEQYDAVILFVECARRVQPAFTLERVGPDVARICRLVEGMPLAIEMAAAWVKNLPCVDIANELKHNLAFLSSRLRNAPPRHRSMEAAFDHSWRLLSEQERAAFARLSVFRGGFTRDAAAHVAGASLLDLSSLVDKSFLYCTPTGRYGIHELLRQYGEERLAESADNLAAARKHHGRFFTISFAERIRLFLFEDQLKSVPSCRAEADNLRTAWNWAVQHCDVDAIRNSTTMYHWIFQFQNAYLEGVNALSAASERLQIESENPTIAAALIEVWAHLSWLQLRLGRLEHAETTASNCLSLKHKYNILPQPTWGGGSYLAVLSIIAAIRGDNVEAEALAKKELASLRSEDRWYDFPITSYALANALLAGGRIDEARQVIQEAIDVSRQRREQWFIAYCLTTLGRIELTCGNLHAADKLFQAAYELREKFGDAEGTAVALNHMGEIALALGDPQVARQRYANSIERYRHLNDRGGLATALKGLGDSARMAGQFSVAERHYGEALQLAREMQYVSLLLKLLLACGDLFAQTQRPALSQSVLTLVLHHPGSDEASRASALELLERQNASIVPPPGEAHWQAVLDVECLRISQMMQTTESTPVRH